MHTIDPNEAVKLIRAKAVKFAYNEDDDPKVFVHAIMTQIGAVLDQVGDGSAAYLEAVGGQVKLMIAGLEADEPALPHKHESPLLQRRLRFLRSVAQLLDAKRAVG